MMRGHPTNFALLFGLVLVGISIGARVVSYYNIPNTCYWFNQSCFNVCSNGSTYIHLLEDCSDDCGMLVTKYEFDGVIVKKEKKKRIEK